jgi:hypothetical protein
MKENKRVLKNRIMLGVVAASAALVPLAGMAATSGPAGAAKPKGIICTGTTGTVNTTTDVAKIKNTGCSGNTGGKGKSTGSQTSTSSTEKWSNGDKTVFTETASPTGTNCTDPNTVDDELITGNVTSDTTGSTKAGAAVTAELCAIANPTTGAITIVNAPGVNFVIAK